MQTLIATTRSPRQAFLEDETRRVRFVYTPKHSSWLNQVEIWFSTLTRRRLPAFIKVFNETLAKPFRWTYIGKPLMA